jgi:hypothetical protein
MAPNASANPSSEPAFSVSLILISSISHYYSPILRAAIKLSLKPVGGINPQGNKPGPSLPYQPTPIKIIDKSFS